MSIVMDTGSEWVKVNHFTIILFIESYQQQQKSCSIQSDPVSWTVSIQVSITFKVLFIKDVAL